jgi:hypothetical protein
MPQNTPPDQVCTPMSTDNAALRQKLSDQWQKVAIDLIKGGVPAEAVFESMLTVGLAGHVEVHGKDMTAAKIAAIAHELSEQFRQEAEAVREASAATKN